MRHLYLSAIAAISQLAALSSSFPLANPLVDSRHDHQAGDLTTSIKV